MRIEQLTKLELFPEYYKQYGLETADEKIEHLTSIVRVPDMRLQGQTPEYNLKALEELIVSGAWGF